MDNWLDKMGKEWDRLQDSDIQDEPTHDNWWLPIGALAILLALWWGFTILSDMLN
jgi:hypothetical protein